MSLCHPRRGKTDGTQSASQETSHRCLSLQPMHDSGSGATDAGRRRSWLVHVRSRHFVCCCYPGSLHLIDAAQALVGVTGAVKDVSGAVIGQATWSTVWPAVLGSVATPTAVAIVWTSGGAPFELRVGREGFADVSRRLTGTARDVTRTSRCRSGVSPTRWS